MPNTLRNLLLQQRNEKDVELVKDALQLTVEDVLIPLINLSLEEREC